MSSYQYRKSHHGISYTGKLASLYWIRALEPPMMTKLIWGVSVLRGTVGIYPLILIHCFVVFSVVVFESSFVDNSCHMFKFILSTLESGSRHDTNFVTTGATAGCRYKSNMELDIFFVVNTLSNKQSSYWWFETPWRDVTVIITNLPEYANPRDSKRRTATWHVKSGWIRSPQNRVPETCKMLEKMPTFIPSPAIFSTNISFHGLSFNPSMDK